VTKPPNLLSEVDYGAFLVYSPRGRSEVSQTSRKARDAVKFDRPGSITRIVRRLVDVLPAGGLEAFLGPQVALVPVPGHAPLVSRDALGVGRRICEELRMQGLGGAVFPCLERIAAVAKSAYARPGERPSPRDHLRSMALEPSVVTHARITVVDDFVTRGSSLLAAASLVKAAFPEAEVLAFALIRTMGLVPEVEQIIDPCVGKIRLRGDEAFRDP
jgi:hypothetical protein